MSADLVDELQSAEDRLGLLQSLAEKASKATDSATFFDAVSHLITEAGTPWMRGECESHECGEDCGGYHPPHFTEGCDDDCRGTHRED